MGTEVLTAVDATAHGLVDFGFTIFVSAIFIVATIILFLSTNKRYTQLFNEVVGSNNKKNEDISANLSSLVSQISQVLSIVQDYQDGMNHRALRYQTYTGAMKIVKSYMNSTKLDVIKGTMKIVEKNNIHDTEAVRRKVQTLILGMNKKRVVDLTEFMYSEIRLSDAIVIDIDALTNLLVRYIQDKDRSMDRFVGDLDSFFYEVINNVDVKFINEGAGK